MIADNQINQKVSISFREDFAALSRDRQAAAVLAMATLLEVSPDVLETHSRRSGRPEFNITLPAGAVEQLQALLQANSGSLRLLGIEEVTLQQGSGATQKWTIDRGRFNVRVSVPPKLVSRTNQAEAQLEEKQPTFESGARIWLFHLIYFFVTGVLSISIFQYSPLVAMSLLFIAVMCACGILLAGLRRLLAAHILAVAVGLGAPLVVFGRLLPPQTVLLFSGLVCVIFLVRRYLF